MERNRPNLAWILSFIWSVIFIWFFFAQEKKIKDLEKLHTGLNTVFHKGDLFLASIFSNDLPSYVEDKKVLLAYIDYYKSDLRSGSFGDIQIEKILYLFSEMEQLIYAMEKSAFPPPEVIQNDFLRINQEVHGIAQRTTTASKNKAWMESFAILFFLIGLGILNYNLWLKNSPVFLPRQRKLTLG
jgi:hypothetical protein